MSVLPPARKPRQALPLRCEMLQSGAAHAGDGRTIGQERA
jgi:hypothetical protein